MIHKQGNLLKEDTTTIFLRGVNYGYNFVDNAQGYWMDSSLFTEEKATEALQLVKIFGANTIRVHYAYRLWKDNVQNFRSTIEQLANICENIGLYFILDGYNIAPYGEAGYKAAPLPYPNENNMVIGSVQEWIDILVSISQTLASKPKFILELHNETMGNFEYIQSIFQQAITQIRETEYRNPIVYQFGSNTGISLDNLSYEGNRIKHWFNQYPLVDSLDNLLVSTHQYRSDHGLGWYETNPHTFPKSRDEILEADQYIGLFEVAEQTPVFIGECGFEDHLTGTARQQEIEGVGNQMQLYHEHKIHYCSWWWRHELTYRQFTDRMNPLNTLTTGGQLFQQYLQGTTTQASLVPLLVALLLVSGAILLGGESS